MNAHSPRMASGIDGWIFQPDIAWPSSCRRALTADMRQDSRLDLPDRQPVLMAPDASLCLSQVERRVPIRPVPPLWRRRTLGLLASTLLHLAIAVAALALLPTPPETDAARGGTDQFMDVMIVGEADIAATQEGVKPDPMPDRMPEHAQETVALVLPELPQPPSPELPKTTALVEPGPTEFELPAVPEVAPLAMPPESLVAARQDAPLAANASKKAPETKPPKPKPAKAMAVASPEAKGRQGHGESRATSAASSRGGSVGAAPHAGSAAITSHRARIVAHLTRFKTYPEAAQDRGIGGRNAVTITLSRDGRVVSSTIASASGQPLLDSATLVAVRRAEPFPAMPEGGPPTFTVTIGLRYDVR